MSAAPTTYRILSNAFARRGFTVRELARLADAKPTTVRTTLSRFRHLFDVRVRATFGRPGGRERTRGLQERIAELEAELEMPT